MARLFLDVDGVINANMPQGWGPLKTGKASVTDQDPGWDRPRVRTYKINWAPAMVEELFSLGMTLTWATTWRGSAVSSIAPLIGHGRYASWLNPDDESKMRDWSILWKFEELQRIDHVEPFVWIDDEITDTHKAWATAAGGLAIRPRAHTGISLADIQTIKEFLERTAS